jgi:eukaryotic-like serine/threonine-protein kinase
VNDARSPADATESVDGEGDDERDPFERIAEEFIERRRKGETPSVFEYLERYPDHAETIQKLLPAVAMIERLGQGDGQPANGNVTRQLPAQLGDFRITRELGRGGMGVVYEAIQESLGRSVALKVMHQVQRDSRRLQRFQREAQAVARLHHTNIVPIFAVGEHDGVPYYAMQYIRGRGLDALLEDWRRDKAPPSAERRRFAARIGIQAAEAIQYAHDQGILHRDVKPANLLVDEYQSVWITDFGLAKLAGHDDLTRTGDVIGTLRYLAPESLRGQTGPENDIYSLGLTLYELITLNSPFGELSPSELLRQLSESEPARPRSVDPTIPRDLETIVLKAIAPEPGHRYPTAQALADDLRSFALDRPIKARRATVLERIGRWGRRNRAIAALTATAAAALVLAAVVGWAGYASTKQALRRSEQNVELSLGVFGALFEKLSPDENFFPPPTGRRMHRRRPPGPSERGTGPDHGPGFGPPFEPAFGGSAPGRNGTLDQTALLQSVLDFYERFAQSNETNSRLQGEAARAYFRIGSLLERLDRPKEAEQAMARAAEMFERLLKQSPSVVEYRSKLIEIAIMTDPWSVEPSSLPQLESRLRRAREIVDQLASEMPENLDHVQSQIHVYAKVGAVIQRLDRPGEAESFYRRAIEFAASLMKRLKSPARATIDRADVREALALLVLERGQRDEALNLMEGAVDDLRSLQGSRNVWPLLSERFETLADRFRKLGEAGRAETVAGLVRAVGGRPPRKPSGDIEEQDNRR